MARRSPADGEPCQGWRTRTSVQRLTRPKGTQVTSEKPLRRYGVTASRCIDAADKDKDVRPPVPPDQARAPPSRRASLHGHARLPGPRPPRQRSRGPRAVRLRVRLHLDRRGHRLAELPALRPAAGLVARAGGDRAGEGNRTPISGLGSQRLDHWTTPARLGRSLTCAGYAGGL